MAKLSWSEANRNLPARDWREFDCAMVEAPFGIEFLDLREDIEIARLNDYTNGLAFGAHSELRWMNRTAGIHLVYISDVENVLNGCDQPQELEPLDAEPRQAVLWGERQADGAYHEGRIPRALRYPAWAPNPGPGGRLAVRLRHYRFRGPYGLCYLSRCVQLIAAEVRYA